MKKMIYLSRKLEMRGESVTFSRRNENEGQCFWVSKSAQNKGGVMAVVEQRDKRSSP